MAYSLDKKEVPDISEIRALAVKYSKDQLRRLARMNLVDPGDAVMAGMMIDRIRAQNMQPPLQTVADDALGINAKPEVMPQQAMPQQAGVTALPSGLPAEMAGGGIVAFADGGDIYDYADGGVVGYAKGDLINAADTVRRSGMTPDQLAQMFASAGPGAPADSGTPAAQPAQNESQGVTLPGGLKLRDYPVRPRPTLQQELDAIAEAERAVGLDDEALFKQLGEEDKARREELKARKDQAYGNALIMGGFGLMGAREGEEFEVLSTVGRQGVMQYGAAMKEIRETENDIRKSERALLLAKNQLKRDKSAKAKENYDNKLKAYDTAIENATIQYNDSIKTLANLNEKYISGERQAATQLAVAQINRNTQLDVEKLRQARAGMGETYMLAKEVLADLRKTNPNATLADALAIVKGSGKTNQLQLIESYADDYNKLDILQRKDFEKRGITNEEDYIKYRIGLGSKYSGGTQSTSPPSAAVDYLKKNPGLAADFDSKYGAGSAARILGTR